MNADRLYMLFPVSARPDTLNSLSHNVNCSLVHSLNYITEHTYCSRLLNHTNPGVNIFGLNSKSMSSLMAICGKRYLVLRDKRRGPSTGPWGTEIQYTVYLCTKTYPLLSTKYFTLRWDSQDVLSKESNCLV